MLGYVDSVVSRINQNFERTCEWNGGKCQKIATSAVQLADNGKWYATCDQHAHWAMRGKANYRELDSVVGGQ